MAGTDFLHDRRVFAKRFWGFSPETWPIISFGLEGNRDALIRASRPGDLIAFIGTQDEPTAPDEQGRLLGLAEIGRIPIDSLQVLSADDLEPHAFDEAGNFRWPKALPMLKAWRFDDPRPLVTDVLRRQLTYAATVRALRLDDEDRNAVLALPRSAAPLPDVDVLTRQAALSAALALGPTTGPKPGNWSGTVTHDADRPSHTYAFRFATRHIWKIGHAQDLASRLGDVNRHIPHEVTGEQWGRGWSQAWPSQEAAYAMEQRVLHLLASHRTLGERVECSEAQLQDAWVKAVVSGR